MRFYTTASLGILAALGMAMHVEGSESKDKDHVQRKTVTVINAESSADGSTQIGRESMKECIISLPKAEALEPEVISDSRFLKEIGGDASKNEFVKIYTAKITINYIVYHKEMLIVATKSIEGKDPVMKEIEKRLPETQEFISNPADGDTFAGHSNRQYYFADKELAIKDVKARVMVWLKQKAPLVCADTK